jgi:hypothetical protein
VFRRTADAGRWTAAVAVAAPPGAARPAVTAGESSVVPARRHGRARRSASVVPPTRPGPQGQRRWCPPGGRPAPGAWLRSCRPPGGGQRGRVGGPPTAACPRLRHGPARAARPSGAAGAASMVPGRRQARAGRVARSVPPARPGAKHPRRPTPHAADRRNPGDFLMLTCADRRCAPTPRSAGRLMRAVRRQSNLSPLESRSDIISPSVSAKY